MNRPLILTLAFLLLSAAGDMPPASAKEAYDENSIKLLEAKASGYEANMDYSGAEAVLKKIAAARTLLVGDQITEDDYSQVAASLRNLARIYKLEGKRRESKMVFFPGRAPCHRRIQSTPGADRIPGGRSHPVLPTGCVPSVSPTFMRSRVRWLEVSRLAMAGIVAGGAMLLTGCTNVPVWKQGLVSKPNMVFNDRGAFVYGPRLNAQIESGSADNGGAAAAGCTACK